MSASSLSVAFTRVSISARVTPSMVVGICVGSELGRAPVTVTMPSDLARSGASWAMASVATQGKAATSASDRRDLFMKAWRDL